MSFANQALCSEFVAKASNLQTKVYTVPKEIDEKVAELKLKSMGVDIDELTAEQKKYLSTWEMGTT
jgi:adenosylhomocysteinase